MVNIVSGKSEKYEKMMKEDLKMVKGKFFCHEPKGGSVDFSFRKYKEKPTEYYKMVDGQEYEVPRMIAKHLNDCGWDVHAHILDANGNPCTGTGKRERRFTFQSLDFV